MSDFHEFRNESLLKKRPLDISAEKWNLFLSEMDRANNFERQDHPVQIDIEMNSGCNMACPFCTHGYEDIKNENMPNNKYYEIIDEAVAMGVKSLKLNYINEPMLRKDLEDLIRYAKDAGIVNIYLATNGTLLNADRRKKMIQSGITKIFISIDATTPKTYNLQRLDGRFNLVVNNVCELIKDRNSQGLDFPIIRVSFLKNQLNIDEADDFDEFWRDKADMIAYQKMNEVPDIDTGLTIQDDDIPETGCEFPFKQLVVTAGGDILPCCKLSGIKLKLGNIQDMTLTEAWNSPDMIKLQNIHSEGKWKDYDICRNCMTGCG